MAKLADPDYPDEYVWKMVWGISAAEREGEHRQRAPRQTGEAFRQVVAVYNIERDGEAIAKRRWVDERIESAAKHIARGLDPRAVADGRDKPSGATERQQISRLGKLLSENSEPARWSGAGT